MDRKLRNATMLFELEMLEPRVLLSATPDVAATSACTSLVPTLEVSTKDPSGANTQNQTSYDPAAQVNSIFQDASSDHPGPSSTASDSDKSCSNSHSESKTEAGSSSQASSATD